MSVYAAHKDFADRAASDPTLGPPFVAELAHQLLASDDDLRGPIGWLSVRDLVRRDLLPPPHDARYARRFVLFETGMSYARADRLQERLLDDRLALDHELWLIFAFDCGLELSRARYVGTELDGANVWTRALVELSGGAIERRRLLEAALDALARPVSAQRLTWYAELVDALAPSGAEIEALGGRLDALQDDGRPTARRCAQRLRRRVGRPTG